jgi:hypothetical protein
MASLSICSWRSSSTPTCLPKASAEIVVMLSQLTTDGPASPFAASTDTSVERPRIVVAIGAT